MRATDRRPRRVLLVEDDPDTMGLLRQLCRAADLIVDEAGDAESALGLARERLPDVVLSDVVLMGMDGIELTRQIVSDPRFAGIPVLILSSRRTQDTKIAAFEAGAADYIEKPFQLAELEARLLAHLRRRQAYEKLERVNWELRLVNERLTELATTDELTGLTNARHFRERLAEEFSRADRYRTPLAVIMSDLDGFKAVNDHHGHAAGDRLLAQVAQRLRAQARSTDIVGRYGGDEFAFLLPHTTIEEALTLAQRLSRRISDAPIRLPNGRPAGVALSCGVASLLDTPGITTAAELLRAADLALYEAKHHGGGGVVAAAGPQDTAALCAAGSTPPAPETTPQKQREMPRPRSPRGAGAA